MGHRTRGAFALRTIEKNETPFRIGVAAGAALLALAIVRLRFCYDVAVPPMPPRPAPRKVTAREVNRTVERSPGFYAEFVAKDARTYEVTPAPGPAEIARPMAYRAEDVRLVLDPADRTRSRAETMGLVLGLSLQSIENSPDRQMILSIENTTEQYLAYRIVTRPSRGTTPCHRKADLAHNAVALAPGATEQRSECLWNHGWTLAVDRIELIELPPLAFHYVGLLPAGAAVGLDARTSRGHRSPDSEPPCRLFHSAEIDNNLQSGVTSWRDLIDFYARHRCKTYSFPTGYRAIEAGQSISLPAAPESG